MKLLHFAHPSGDIGPGLEIFVAVEDDIPESEYGDYGRSGWTLKTVMNCDAAKGYIEDSLPLDQEMISH